MPGTEITTLGIHYLSTLSDRVGVHNKYAKNTSDINRFVKPIPVQERKL